MMYPHLTDEQQKQLQLIASSKEFSHLAQGLDRYSGKLAARNIRKDLKKHFPKQKFSVTKQNGTILIFWEGEVQHDEVVSIAYKYRNNLYSPEGTPRNLFPDVFGGCGIIIAQKLRG